MFAKLNSVKTLKTLIKLSAMALTSPATVAVASGLYPNNIITKIVVSAAALILIEGCLLLGWEMLDQQSKHAAIAQRWLYAGLARVAYFALFGIAMYHQEGIAGFAFRLTLGVMLIYACLEAGLLAGIKTKKQTEKDIFKDRRVRRYTRRLARRAAMADLDSADRMRQTDRNTHEKLYLLRANRQAGQQIHLIDAEASFDTQDLVEMAKSDTQTVNSLDKANQKRRLSKQQALDQTVQILTEMPSAKPSEIAARIGRSRQTVYDYLKELERQDKIHRNGSGVKIAN